MFVDYAEIEVTAGNGGNGMVTFRKEKYVPHGGPNGGDGGKGGDIVLEVDSHLSTLLDFRFQRHYRAENGGDGQSKDMFGKNGRDLVLKVPIGTIVHDMETDEILCDLAHPQARFIVAHGGEGGRGNAHFATSVQQAPKFAEKGAPGESRKLRLELKLLADVGLLGFPSVGKSTLISAVSAARPKIADYPFTTLVPNLGVVSVDLHKSFVMADLPGIIEGAHEGVGLGHRFLRHVERTKALVHILDVSGLSGRDPLHDYHVLNEELRLHREELLQLPQIVALNKTDIIADEELVQRTEDQLRQAGREVFRISAVTRKGLEQLLYAIWNALEKAREADPVLEPAVVTEIKAHPEDDLRQWRISKSDEGYWVVEGKALEKLVAMTDVDNEYALRRMQRTLERIDFNNKLRRFGVSEGDTVRIGRMEFVFEDDDIDIERYQSRRHRRRSIEAEE